MTAASARTRGHWGLAELHCDGRRITGGPGDLLSLLVGPTHAYVVGPASRGGCRP